MSQNLRSTPAAPRTDQSIGSTRTSTTSATAAIQQYLDHWAWKLYIYGFTALYIVFVLNCLVILQRQCKQPSTQNIHRRFTTTQLLVGATLRAVALLWVPYIGAPSSAAEFTAALVVYSLSAALVLSAFSVLLLILLETTKVSIAPPRLQNNCVLASLNGAFTATVVAFNLLAAFHDGELWRFVTEVVIFVWGTLVCVGYAWAGFKMWGNLRASRCAHTAHGLKRIILLVYSSSFVTAVLLILLLLTSVGDFDSLEGLKFDERSFWTRYAVAILIELCNIVIILLIFGFVFRGKCRENRVNEASGVQLGTFTQQTT